MFKLNSDNFKKFLDHFEKKATVNIQDNRQGNSSNRYGRKNDKFEFLKNDKNCTSSNFRPKSVKDNKLILGNTFIN